MISRHACPKPSYPRANALFASHRTLPLPQNIMQSAICLVTLVAAYASAAIPQLQCGPVQPVNKIGASVDLDGPPEYMATINGVGTYALKMCAVQMATGA